MEDITTPSPPADIPADATEAKADNTIGSMLSSSKTQLAIGVAATLGVMIFYKWRERQLAEKDPEEYARLQRIKASVRNGELHINGNDDDIVTPDVTPPQLPPEAATGTER